MKTKTKNKEIKTANVGGQDLVIYDGVVYVGYEREIRNAIETGKDSDGEPLSSYTQAKVDDCKALIAAINGLDEAVAIVNKTREKIEGMILFGNPVNIDADGDIEIGCTCVKVKEAQAFLKKLN